MLPEPRKLKRARRLFAEAAFGERRHVGRGPVAFAAFLEPVAERGDAGKPRALSAVVEGVIFGDSPV